MMRQYCLLLVVFVFTFGAVSAQETKPWYERDMTLSLGARMGTNYAPIFGARLSKYGVFTMVDLAHKSGFGVGYYRMDDFSLETTGRIGFLDVYWAGSPVKNLSLYIAAEGGRWANWKEGRFSSLYSDVSYRWGKWTFKTIPLYIYYDRLPDANHQVVIKVEVAKSICDGTSVRIAGWYDNLNPRKFYYAAGITQQLPLRTYLSLDGVLKPGAENFIAIGFGWRISSNPK